MGIDTKPVPTISRAKWLSALDAHRKEEKALTAQLDALAAERRRLPRERVETDYEFDTPEGSMRLGDLFDGRSQLIIYHHMLKPGDKTPCSGCCMFADQIPHLAHLHARDTSLVFVARAPVDEIEALKARLKWQFPFVSTGEAFNWSAPIEWSSINVSAWSAFGLSGRCFRALVDGIRERCAVGWCCSDDAISRSGSGPRAASRRAHRSAARPESGR